MKLILQFIFILTLVGPLYAEEKFVWTEQSTDKSTVSVFTKNPQITQKTIRVELGGFKNLIVPNNSRTLAKTAIIPPKAARHKLMQMKLIDPEKPFFINFSWNSAIGNAFTAHHDEDHLYYLPFQHGEKYLVSQYYYGAISHNIPGSYFAIDFDMPSGTKICAARSGKVVFVKEDSDEGGGSAEFSTKGNFVSILHNDGTIASYTHMPKQGVSVDVGDIVKAGQVIGIAGNTGWSNGSHLDFAVHYPQANGKRRSIPVRFRTKAGKPLSPQLGLYYYSYHDGEPEFDTVFGRDITNQTFANHKVKLSYSKNKVEVRSEWIDETLVFYLRNKDKVPHKVSFTLKLSKNLTPSFPLPHKVTAKPQEERFLMFLRKIDPNGAWEFDYSMDRL